MLYPFVWRSRVTISRSAALSFFDMETFFRRLNHLAYGEMYVFYVYFFLHWTEHMILDVALDKINFVPAQATSPLAWHSLKHIYDLFFGAKTAKDLQQEDRIYISEPKIPQSYDYSTRYDYSATAGTRTTKMLI